MRIPEAEAPRYIVHRRFYPSQFKPCYQPPPPSTTTSITITKRSHPTKLNPIPSTIRRPHRQIPKQFSPSPFAHILTSPPGVDCSFRFSFSSSHGYSPCYSSHPISGPQLPSSATDTIWYTGRRTRQGQPACVSGY